ncbi:hypothetical protein [Ruminiclostridium cellobioparum]|jgi:hypothetical protein|uniref:Uncharacterized protein n=1 Tax=Ruminiclostridium cellobioparum subsp. termitidis CT1112 TaxID=1195236 RepID=S0FZ05_RUMCE|nr:hypothetical protein [Ruminiclostridium cellobioparum]EMS73793.1 hypothetical protein CTER_0269 [Ruminiclostridium cellobioparum subsp. termitidis CT1112]
MTNQVIVWSMLILPWLSLFFMKKEEIRRWMPVALFTMVTNTIIIDIGVGLKLWETRVNIFPLDQMISFVYGVLPIAAMWIFKFTYGRFWLYFVIEILLSTLFIRVIHPWLHRRGIFIWLNQDFLKGIWIYVMTITHYLLIYLYGMWQDGKFARPHKNRS